LTTETSEWYRNIDPREKFARGDLQTMNYLLNLIETCVSSYRQHPAKNPQDMDALRTKIHEMEFHEFLNPTIIKKSRVLEEGGLPRIFQNTLDDVEFPWDIKTDAEALYNRWISGDLGMCLIRSWMLKAICCTSRSIQNLQPSSYIPCQAC
jgi:hypothetical protein